MIILAEFNFYWQNITSNYTSMTSPFLVPLLPFTIRYDTRCYFNVRSKADISQLNLPHVFYLPACRHYFVKILPEYVADCVFVIDVMASTWTKVVD